MNGTELIDAYFAGIDDVERAVAGMTDEQLRARPIAGQWSSLEVICHLADTEALFAERMKRVLAEDRPTLMYVDPDRHAAALAFHHRDAAEEIALLGAVRRQMTRILRAQPPAAWRRVGVHSTDGERTLEQLVRKCVDHLAHHLRFIQAKRAVLRT
jgi:uncharacterized damage-inducible protein DinB